MPISLPTSSVTAGGRNGLAPSAQPWVSPESLGSASYEMVASVSAWDLRRVEPVSAVADQELGAIGQHGAADAHEHPVRALKIGDHPPVHSAGRLQRDLDVARRHPAVDRVS